MKKYMDKRTVVLTSLVLLLFVVGFTYNSLMNDDYLKSEDKTASKNGDVFIVSDEMGGDPDAKNTEVGQTDAELQNGVADQTTMGEDTKTPLAEIDKADKTAETSASAQQTTGDKASEAAKVDKDDTAVSAFFSEYRLEREKNRSKEKELWEDIINSSSTEETFKTAAQQELVKMVALTEKEMIIENLIIAKGFNDALVFMSDDSATVVVNTKSLDQQKVAQIQDIIMRKTNIPAENIKIMQKD